ncbi:MAG: tol-pal system YbgF family protein [Bradymonadaceae bacterium]
MSGSTISSIALAAVSLVGVCALTRPATAHQPPAESASARSADSNERSRSNQREEGRSESSTGGTDRTADGVDPLVSLALRDPAWQSYRDAFVALAADDRERARKTLERLLEEHPDHPAAALARPVLVKLRSRTSPRTPDDATKDSGRSDGAAAESGGPKPADRLGLEPPTTVDRAKLVAYQTIHGIGLGVEFCAMVHCGSPRAGGAAALIGGGAGVAGSLLFTDRKMAPGHTLAVNTGTNWGAWNAGAVYGIAVRSSDSRVSGAALAGTLAFGQLVGVAGAGAAWRGLRPYSGDVAMFNAGGLWSGTLAGLLLASSNPLVEMGTAGNLSVLLAATDLGAVAGAWAASIQPMTRGRVHVINLGGIVGGLVTLGATVFIGGQRVSGNVATGMLAGGIGAGLGVTTYLTNSWRVGDGGTNDGENSAIWMAPGPSRNGWGLSIRGTF